VRRRGHPEQGCGASGWATSTWPRRLGAHLVLESRCPSRIGKPARHHPEGPGEGPLTASRTSSIDPKESPFASGELLSEDKYYKAVERRLGDEAFTAGMGGEAVRELLKKIDIEVLGEQLRKGHEGGDQRRQGGKKLAKRLKVVESFRESGNKPRVDDAGRDPGDSRRNLRPPGSRSTAAALRHLRPERPLPARDSTATTA